MSKIIEEDKKEKWLVYIIETANGKLYTGITNNLHRRFHQHQKQAKEGARFFHFSAPKKILFLESHPDRSAASKREYAIKKMSRKEKELLIQTIWKRDSFPFYGE